MKWLLLLACSTMSVIAAEQSIPNQLIDAGQFRQTVQASLKAREQGRLTEAEFLAALRDRQVVVLDARSAHLYARRHVEGAVNLPFTEFTAATLAGVIPSKTTKVVIYCNNNFRGDQIAFASKAPAASLNLSTQASLRAYGYENVFELGPLLDVRRTSIPFAGSEVE